MAAVASPTPMAFSSSANEFRRPATRLIVRTSYSRSYGHRSPAAGARRKHTPKQDSGDSSDEDDLAPIKLSAEAQAILGEDNSQIGPEKENVNIYARHAGAEKAQCGANPAAERLRTRIQGNGSPAPRLAPATAASRPTLTAVARDGSFMYKTHEKSSVIPHRPIQESQTPPKPKRVIRVSTGRKSPRSPPATQPEATGNGDIREREVEAEASPQSPETRDGPEDEIDIGPSTIARTRKADENAAHSTMRVRRIGVGSMLGKPVRRGMIRRPSEDDQHPSNHQDRETSRSPEIEIGRRAKEEDLPDNPDLDMASYGSPRLAARAPSADPSKRQAPLSKQDSPSGSPIPIAFSLSTNKGKPTPASSGSHPSTRSSSSHRKPAFKVPPLPLVQPEQDQDHEPPPTFKRTKPSALELQIHEDTAPSQEDPAPASSAPRVSPSRPPLQPISHNTPHRPAPAPPPKMSLLEAATTSSTTRKPKSSHVIINNRTYRRLDCIGRGGSSRVYRVMADNFKIFALKRVNLDDADISAIAGYKGEIDLLRKLENEDRVIRLFDYEINEDKCILNELMELGETDFNKMLNEQLKSDNAKLDVTFTRYYWKEMLACVQAVHQHGVVHSDLKPANFLLVKGQLKLIDFGIANAIQDNTVNVHRENQIGTPNYMSPESLICQSVISGPNGEKKDIKLGKPSDVWSLGCILYQMTYGQPPFAHIPQQMQRIMAIPNPKVEIAFPGTGVGGVVVPFGLIKTLRRCLTREASLRPTIPELLSESDGFLYPVAISPDMLGRVIGNVVGYCRRREESLRSKGLLQVSVDGEGGGEEGDGEASCLPKDDEMRGWPLAFYEKLRQAQVEGTAW